MDLTSVVQTLSSEMGLPLEARGTLQMDENVIAAKVYIGDELYGAIALITDEIGTLQSCTYLGEYPGQTGVELPNIGKRDQVSLDLERRHVPFSIEDAPRLVRIDHNNVPFLGSVYDGWDSYEYTHRMSKTSIYAKQLLEK